MGLLDDFLNSDETRTGIALLAAASPTMRPMGFGERLGMAMNTIDDQKARKEQLDMMKEYRAAQIAQMQLAMDEKKRKNDMQEAFMAQLTGIATPQAQPVPLPQLGEAQGTGPYRLNVDTPEARASIASQIAQLEKTDPVAAKQVVAALVKQGAIPQPMQQVQPDMNRLAQLSMLGQLAGLDGAKGVMDYANFAKPDMKYQDSGSSLIPVNMNGGQLPVINKGMSPGEIASNQVAWANNAVAQGNLDVSRYNAQKPTYHDGALVGPDGSVTKTPMYTPPKNSPEANANASQRIIPLLETADKLLNQATGSYLGAGRDVAAGAIGISTQGAKAAAQLKALEGQIMLNQPRMEGPQSDRDTALYRQMAGQIGDSTVPVETRRAALEGIRRLHEQYANQNPSPNRKSTISPGGWSATEVR